MGRSWDTMLLCWYKRSQWFKECTGPTQDFVEWSKCLLIHPNSDWCWNDHLFLQIVLVVDKDAQKLTLQTGSIFNERAYCAFSSMISIPLESTTVGSLSRCQPVAVTWTRLFESTSKSDDDCVQVLWSFPLVAQWAQSSVVIHFASGPRVFSISSVGH